jgi:hypothetical protein
MRVRGLLRVSSSAFGHRPPGGRTASIWTIGTIAAIATNIVVGARGRELPECPRRRSFDRGGDSTGGPY